MQTLQELINSISGGTRAAHAFAVEGEAGEDRRAFVDTIAAGLECTCDDPGIRPCGRCPSCIQVQAGTSMDIVRMSKSTGTSRSGREIYRTSDASAFIERLSMGAYGRYLIGIIDDADTLSEIIQNKLLKTLEEPAPDTVIILAVSNRDNLLDTVLSRVSCIRMSEYGQYGDMAEDSDEEDGALSEAAAALAAMYSDRTAAFHEVRSETDKNIKTREEALTLLDAIEDEYRSRMLSLSNEASTAEALGCAGAIELINEARMDIRRDMGHVKALKRLYLELL